MELPAVGEHVFAVESIEKKRIRKVRRERGGEAERGAAGGRAVGPAERRVFASRAPQGRVEYLVKWRGWSPK